MDDCSTVIQTALPCHRQAHQQYRRQRRRCIEHLPERCFCGVQQRALMKQVVAGIPAQTQFREHHHRGVTRHRLPGERNGFTRIGRRIGQMNPRHRHCSAQKVMPMEIEEIHARAAMWRKHARTLRRRPALSAS